MFKHILSALRGAQSDAPSVRDLPAETTESPSFEGEPVTAYDAYGRELKIPRREWWESVILPALEQQWDSAPALYDLIVSGLNDGFDAELLPAAERLVEIDDDAERCHVVLGTVLMKKGKLQAAEAALREGMAKAGATGSLLTTLAQLLGKQGKDELVDQTLWQAIQADPNQENAILWWSAIQRERGGDEAYLEGLRTVGALPGSWRAQVWMARHYLEHEEAEAALALYGEVLAGGTFDGSALMTITGDLGKHGQIRSLIDLVGPIYDEHKHDPMAGLNLLQAHQQFGNVKEGEALLSRMYALGIAPLKQHLDQFAEAFHQIGGQAAQGTPVNPADLEISTLALARPIWHYGLRNADWLFTPKPEGAKEIGFFALSMTMDRSAGPESQREDDMGRLTRAIPLYLAEAAHYWTDYSASCYFQIVEGGGPVVTGSETDGNALFDIVPRGMMYFVTGAIGSSGTGQDLRRDISLSLWNCATRTRDAVERGKAVEAEFGALIHSLEERLLARVGMKREQPLDGFYLHPTAEVLPVYLSGLGQAFTLTLAASKHTAASGMWGERIMLEWPLNMALQWPTVEVPKLMYISGLAKAVDYKSQVLPEYKERSLQLLRESERADSPAARLAPVVWKAFDMQEELQAYVGSLPADTTPAYKAWIERVLAWE